MRRKLSREIEEAKLNATRADALVEIAIRTQKEGDALQAQTWQPIGKHPRNRRTGPLGTLLRRRDEEATVARGAAREADGVAAHHRAEVALTLCTQRGLHRLLASHRHRHDIIPARHHRALVDGLHRAPARGLEAFHTKGHVARMHARPIHVRTHLLLLKSLQLRTCSKARGLDA